MIKSKLSSQSQPALIEHLAHHYKQASVLSNDPEQGLVINAILDTDGGIGLDSQDPQDSNSPSLTTGRIRDQQLNQDHFLALLLDADDVSALIESNVEYINTPKQNPLLLNTNNKTILKIEDVLHEDDSLDEYLPPDNDRWYLYGDGKALDKAISSPSFRDIHDELLMQQLLTQNPAE